MSHSYRSALQAKAEHIVQTMTDWYPEVDALLLAELLQGMVELALEKVRGL